MMMGKLRELLRVATRDRDEFQDRLKTIIQPRLEGISDHSAAYQPVGESEMLALGSEAVGVDLTQFVGDDACRKVTELVRQRMESIGDSGPFLPIYNADLRFARFCYALCRATVPEHVIETGVAYGVTSAFVLQALAENRQGNLTSIDLPPLSKDSANHVGLVVPDALRTRWDVRIGASERLLPGVLDEVGRVDIFIHDSLHTYANMRREFQTVLPYMRPTGLILADDIETNLAFREFVEQPQVVCWGAGQEDQKSGLYGFSQLAGTKAAVGRGGAYS